MLQAYNVLRKRMQLKPKQRLWLLAIIFITSFIFLIFISGKIDAELNLQRSRTSYRQTVSVPTNHLVENGFVGAALHDENLAGMQADTPRFKSGSRHDNAPADRHRTISESNDIALSNSHRELSTEIRRRATREIFNRDESGAQHKLEEQFREGGRVAWWQQQRAHTLFQHEQQHSQSLPQQEQLQQFLHQQEEQRGAKHASSNMPAVWLYTLLGADYEGTAQLLPHWLRHYLITLQFSKDRLLIVVNQHSSRPEAAAELAAVQGVLDEWGIDHLLWTGKYSSDAHLKVEDMHVCTA